MQTYAMVTKAGLTILLLFCSLAVIEAQSSIPAAAASQELKITSPTDDYFVQNQRQYANNILSMNAQLASYKLNYENQLATMNTQSELLEANLINVDKHLLPLELLNDLSKHCVQKYKSQIATVATVKASISNCVTSAQNNYNSIVTSIQATITNLNNWYNNQLVNQLADCKKTHGNAQLNYTLCVTRVIAGADSTTAASMKTFSTQMQDTTCAGNSRVKQAVDCSFTTVYSTIAKVGEITRLINNCIEGKEYCPPCAIAPTNPTPIKTCSKELTVSLTEAEYKNATITNPFLGLNSSVPCAEVHFKPINKTLK